MSESLAVMAVILVMAAMYFRAGKHAAALLALPLCGVSAGYVACELLDGPLYAWFGLPDQTLTTAVVLASMALSMALCILLAKGRLTVRARSWYIVLSWGFLLAISAAYLLEIR